MKINLQVTGLLVTLIIFFLACFHNELKKTDFDEKQFNLDITNSTHYDRKVFFDSINYAKNSNTSFLSKPRIVIIPHHLTGAYIAADLIRASSKYNYEKIILIGPNHHERGNDKLITNDTITNQNIIDSDHSIGNPLLFIKYYLPETTVDKFLIKHNANSNNIEDWSRTLLNNNEPENTLYIFSIDFSHYLTAIEATVRDKTTISLIKQNAISEILNFTNEYTDSPSGLALALSLVKKLQLSNLQQIHHTNSGFLYSNFSSPVTSYYGLAFFYD